MSMDDFFLSFHGRPPPVPSLSRGDPPRLPLTKEKNANEEWKEVPSGGGLGYEGAAACGEVTLEDFLARNGAMTAADVVAPLEEQEKAGVSVDPAISDRLRRQEQHALLDTAVLGFRNGVVGGGRRRARKRSALDNLADKADIRRQKRMIKNRESAARSRERKQAYTVELESLVSRLEEENAILLSEQEEQYEMRIHQLMENIIPITEKRKPPHILRKIHSMLW
ncbi:bZIP transcription factor 12-like [Zingiber officinale]|uniref:bZIP transcription factor 12-like n=1 Tax=Zingiber officinale TaxID=94328 RepID=UPI001C4B930D|nr:bZIP transcription factor 12-like [Zingiber officinale]